MTTIHTTKRKDRILLGSVLVEESIYDLKIIWLGPFSLLLYNLLRLTGSSRLHSPDSRIQMCKCDVLDSIYLNLITYYYKDGPIPNLLPLYEKYITPIIATIPKAIKIGSGLLDLYSFLT